MRLLVVAPHYRTALQALFNTQATYLDSIEIFIRYNPLLQLAWYMPPLPPIRTARQYTRGSLIQSKEIPPNVNINLVSLTYFIPDGKNRSLGDKFAKKVSDFINKAKIEFDIIHAHFTWPYGYAAAKLKEQFEKPLVVTGHGFDVYDLPFRDMKWREIVEYTLKSADIVLTVSQRNAKCIERLNIGKSIRVIPNGFDPAIFCPKDIPECRSLLGIPIDRIMLLTVGNLVEVKGHQYLIKALRDVVSYEDKVMSVMIGEGPLMNSLIKHIKGNSLNGRVFLMGAKPHHEIPLWMNACDIFVIPSLSEGNPTVMFEALGCGKPVVATRVGGIPEIITSEDYGLLCNPGDPDDLAEKILVALEKKWDHEKIRKYAEQFTWDNIAKQVLAVYEEVLRK